MEGRLVLKNCTLPGPSGELVHRRAIVIEGEYISEVGDDNQTWIKPGDWQLSCDGRLVTLGGVDGHAHLASDQLGLDGPLPTPMELEALLAFGLARALRQGVTWVAEHLRCPENVEEALTAAKRWAKKLGIRVAPSHATRALDLNLKRNPFEENVAFAQSLKFGEWAYPALGLFDAAEGEEALMASAAALSAKSGFSVHLHCAGAAQVERLFRAQLGNGLTVARLYSSEGENVLPAGGALWVLGERGPVPQGLAVPSGEGWALGDNTFGLDAASIERLLSGAAAFRGLFGEAQRTIEAGGSADLVVLDEWPPEGAPGENSAEFWRRAGRARVAWVVCRGRVVVREGRLLGADFPQLAKEAARAVASVRNRKGAR